MLWSCLRGGTHASTLWSLHLLPGDPFGYKGQYALHLWLESRDWGRFLIFLVVLRPETHCPGRFVPSVFFVLLKISSRSLSKFKFFVSLLCIICQSFVIMSLWDVLVPLSKASMYSQRTRSQASLPLRGFSCWGFVEVALHLFVQVSCFVLLFPSLSNLSQQISDHSSFSFLFSVHDCSLDHLVQFGFSFHTFFTAFVPRICPFLSLSSLLRPFQRRFLSNFLVAERCPTCCVNSDLRHPRLAVAIGTLFFRTILCPAIFLASLSWHVSRTAVVFFTFGNLPFQVKGTRKF